VSKLQVVRESLLLVIVAFSAPQFRIRKQIILAVIPGADIGDAISASQKKYPQGGNYNFAFLQLSL
jgi:hypothetical protein